MALGYLRACSAGSVSNLGGSFRLNSLVWASRCSGAMISGRVEPIQGVPPHGGLGAAEFSSPDSRCYSGNIGIRYDRMQQSRRRMCASLYKNLKMRRTSSIRR